MKKKLGIALLIASMSIGSVLPAYAAEVNDKVDEIVTPKYENIAQIIRGFEIDGDWVGTFVINVLPKEVSDIDIKVNIQEYDNDVEDWVTVDTFRDSEKNSYSFGFSDSTKMTPHCVARAEFIVTVTTNGVKEVETRYSYDN